VIEPGTKCMFKPEHHTRLYYALHWMESKSSDGTVEVVVEGTDIDLWGVPFMQKLGNQCALNFALSLKLDALGGIEPTETIYYVKTPNSLGHLVLSTELTPL
jgi:hypothetical protein